MIKAVIFDCFGVLASDGWLAFRSHYLKEHTNEFKQALELNREVDLQITAYEDFLRTAAHLAGVDETRARVEIETRTVNQVLLEYIRTELSGHIRIGLLSNAPDDWLDTIFSSQQVALFDATALSFEMGVVKPSPESYAIIANRLGVSAHDCLFIDDQPKNVVGAKKIGMQALLFESNEQIITALTTLLK